MRIVPLVLAFLFAFAASASAQCTPMPGTGCAGQTNPICGTPPTIGTNSIFRCPPTCFPSLSQFIVIGTPIAPLPPPSPPLCAAGRALTCQPIITLNAPGATLAIPNNPGLIGFQLCIQCLCQPSGGASFTISQGTLATIQ